MKIGLIADIHANVYGLRAVLKKLHDTDVMLCAGDITGYYTFVNEVFDELAKCKVKFIRGNHDNYLIGSKVPPQSEIIKQSVNYARAHILPRNLQIIQHAPETITLNLDSLIVKIFHGSPWKMEYIYPKFSDFDKFLDVDADVIVLGHTHIPMVKYIGEKLIINPGSCGQPRDGDPRASFAIFDTKNKDATVYRVAYDTGPVVDAINRNHIDPQLANILTKRTL